MLRLPGRAYVHSIYPPRAILHFTGPIQRPTHIVSSLPLPRRPLVKLDLRGAPEAIQHGVLRTLVEDARGQRPTIDLSKLTFLAWGKMTV
jgi:hypothetical protein